MEKWIDEIPYNAAGRPREVPRETGSTEEARLSISFSDSHKHILRGVACRLLLYIMLSIDYVHQRHGRKGRAGTLNFQWRLHCFPNCKPKCLYTLPYTDEGITMRLMANQLGRCCVVAVEAVIMAVHPEAGLPRAASHRQLQPEHARNSIPFRKVP
jgi:hypothetical protein